MFTTQNYKRNQKEELARKLQDKFVYFLGYDDWTDADYFADWKLGPVYHRTTNDGDLLTMLIWELYDLE